MASYWKSQPRKFCEICKCWIGDNKASIEFHERGKSHQEKKKRQLEQIRKRGMQQAKENAKASVYLKQIEQAARKQYVKDMEAQGIKINKEEFLKKEQSTSGAIVQKSPVVSNSTIANKKRSASEIQNSVKPEENLAPSFSIPSFPKLNNSKPYGKWTIVKNTPKTEIQQTYIPITLEPVELKFTEKTVSTGAIDNDNYEPASFKKRKMNNRNIRSKMSD